MFKQYRVAVDFDGTIVKHEFPDIGPAVPFAFDWLKWWKEAGALLILWTMRSDGPALTQAVDFCRKYGIEFDGTNEGPGDRMWTSSPKAYAHRYVDDAAFGCPLIHPPQDNPYVDWRKVGPAILKEIEEYNGRWEPSNKAKAGGE